MNTRIIILLGLFFLIQLNIAQSIQLNTTTISVEGVVGESLVVPVGVVNDQNEDIFSVTFFPVNMTSFSRLNRLNASQQGFLVATVKPVQEGSFTLMAKSYFTMLRDVPREPKNVMITITDEGFFPAIVSVKKEDTIIFSNNGTIQHTATVDGGFDYVLLVNGSQSVVMQNVGIIDYFDRFTSLGGSIEVVQKESLEPVFFPQDQKTLAIQVTARLAETNISVRSLTERVDAPYGQETDAVVEVKNTGAKVAKSVRVSAFSDWVRFPNADVGDIPVGGSRIIPFRINPLLNGTGASNQSYVVEVTAAGANLPSVSAQVHIFVPFGIVFTDGSFDQIESAFTDALSFLRFCLENPKHAFCALGGNGSTIRVVEKFANVNVSVGTIVQMQTDIAANREVWESFSKSQKETNDHLLTYLETLNASLTIVALQVRESNTGFATLRGIGYISIVVVLFGGSLCGIAYGIVRWKKRRDAKERILYDG